MTIYDLWSHNSCIRTDSTLYNIFHDTEGSHHLYPIGQMETSKQEEETSYSSSNLLTQTVFFREHGICGKLFEGKKKKIVPPLTADTF